MDRNILENKQDQINKNNRSEFKYGFIILRTDKFSSVFNFLGKKKLVKKTSWISLVVMPIIAAIGVFFLLLTLTALISSPDIREAGRDTGPQALLLIPGINPYLPIIYGWIGIVIGIVAHEGAHGVIAKSLGFEVKSSGLLFFLILPIGAFVEVDDSKMKESRARESLRVLSAGPTINVIIGMISLLGIFLIVLGLSPAVNGLTVIDTMEGMPAQESGIMVNEIIVKVNDIEMNNVSDLSQILNEKRSEVIEVTILNIERWEERTIKMRLRDNEDIKMGITIAPVKSMLTDNLENYKKAFKTFPIIHFMPPTFPIGQTIHPYSEGLRGYYTHSELNDLYLPIANTLYWIWFININLAIFNSLPIYPLDGGQSLNYLIQKGAPNRIRIHSESITRFITLMLVISIIGTIIIPYL